MSQQFPIIAVTGSSGAGTTTVRHAFQDVFRREGITGAFVEGDAFMRYDNQERARLIRQAGKEKKALSLFGPDMHQLDRLEALFKEYAESGNGRIRKYITEDNEEKSGMPVGTFTPWQPIPENTDLLFYEGLHGGMVARAWTRRKMSRSS